MLKLNKTSSTLPHKNPRPMSEPASRYRGVITYNNFVLSISNALHKILAISLVRCRKYSTLEYPVYGICLFTSHVPIYHSFTILSTQFSLNSNHSLESFRYELTQIRCAINKMRVIINIIIS